MFAYLSVCPLAYLKDHASKFSVHVTHVTVARSSSDGKAIRYVLPVLWMTSCFHSAHLHHATMKSAQCRHSVVTGEQQVRTRSEVDQYCTDCYTSTAADVYSIAAFYAKPSSRSGGTCNRLVSEICSGSLQEFNLLL